MCRRRTWSDVYNRKTNEDDFLHGFDFRYEMVVNNFCGWEDSLRGNIERELADRTIVVRLRVLFLRVHNVSTMVVVE